jgi:hypothetical protein
MGEFLKCECSHCGQPIEYPSEGTGETVPCPTCEKPVTLTPVIARREGFFYEIPTQEVATPHPTYEKPVTVAPAYSQNTKEQKTVRTNLSKLTEETIRKKTQAGDTPLHRAAKIGRIFEIPNHLLSIELFAAKNNDGDTSLHLAARFGTLNQVPPQFLTKETLTMKTSPSRAPNGVYFTGSGYEARTPTVLHDAASSGHADQIPKEFLTPEFLLIEATGYKQTVLEHLVKNKMLHLLPENYANSEVWNVKDSNGQTPRRILEILLEREAQLEVWQAERGAYVARVRSEPPTEKQKEKLRFFEYAFDETLTKGQASDALDKCTRDYPEKERAYYSRPATEEQMKILHAHYGKNLDEVDGPFTYGKVKDLIWEIKMAERQKERADDCRENLIRIVVCPNSFGGLPGLTYARVKKAAKALDQTSPGWENEKNPREVLSNKVAELNPELAARNGWPTHAL